MQKMQVWSLGQADPPEKDMATHSSVLAWRIPWTEDPGGQQSLELQRVRHDLVTEPKRTAWVSLEGVQLTTSDSSVFHLPDLGQLRHSVYLRRNGRSYLIWLIPWFWAAAAAKSLQSCPTLCDPIDCSPPGSPVQARTLEWAAISFSNAWKEKWKWSRSVVSDC